MSGASTRWRLDGRTCIVTGGSKGLGLACVEELLALGATVLFTARGADDLEKVRARLAPIHGEDRVLCVAADVSTPAGRSALFDRASSLFDGKLDILINNVGTNIRKPLRRQPRRSMTQWSPRIRPRPSSCASSSSRCCASRSASVVNVASAAGIRSSGTGVIYAMTKAAMVHMSEALACEWAGYGIRVNAVCPWMAMTPLLEAAVAKDPTQLDAVKLATPLGRLGDPADTAGAVCFLCMPAAAYITGQVLAVEGGLAAPGFRGPRRAVRGAQGRRRWRAGAKGEKTG